MGLFTDSGTPFFPAAWPAPICHEGRFLLLPRLKSHRLSHCLGHPKCNFLDLLKATKRPNFFWIKFSDNLHNRKKISSVFSSKKYTIVFQRCGARGSTLCRESKTLARALSKGQAFFTVLARQKVHFCMLLSALKH